VNDEAADPASAFDGQYRLGAEIGAGALGVVYRGVDERLDKHVAIKVWHARFDEITPLREQYDSEARALTALEHPNLVAVTDYGIAGQAPYLIMELLDGQTLDARLRASTLPSAQTQIFMESVLRGLGYMHMRGVVHRNLKPDNIFLHRAEDGTETLKVLDMGLESLPANSNMAGAATMSLAQQSPYDSPEQEAGSEPDGRSDVYAAGVLLLHMLSGREPGRPELRAAADSAAGLARLVPNATPEVRAFIARAVATERSARFGNADQMLRALLELPSPWSTDPEGAPAPAPAPAPTVQPEAYVVESLPPEPTHADFEGSPTSEFHEQTQQPAAAVGDEDIEVGPIGLMARLRARKRLLLIVGGVVVLAGAGATAAALLGQLPLSIAAIGGGEEAVAKGPADPKAKKPEEHEAAAKEEEDEEETEEEAEGASKATETIKFSARLGDGTEEKKPEETEPAGADPAQLGAVVPGAQGQGASAQGSQAAAPGAHGQGASAQGAQPSGLQGLAGPGSAHGSQAAQAKQGPLAAADDHGSKGAASAQLEAQGAATAQPGSPTAQQGAQMGGQLGMNAEQPAGPQPTAAAGEAQGDAAHGPGAEGAAAESGATPPGAAAKATEPEKPKPPTPEELGSVRHIEPDRSEIRQMLALAVAPKPRGASKNPWDISLPDSLQAMRDSIDDGERGSAYNLKTLRRYNSANPDDVYGHLLLAGFYANRGYSLDALDQYDMAYRIDPSSRGAPEMLKHALNMVAQGIAERDAVRFIDRVYGREANAGILQILHAHNTTPAGTARIKKLQARLGAKRR
jgi:tRNA A-37 threonylcarbamoyl transferase component Bud32